MTDTGCIFIQKGRKYEDLVSLKKHIANKRAFGSGNANGFYYDQHNIKEIITNFNVTTTGTADEIEVDDGIAIGNIGKAEVTLVFAANADHATYEDATMVVTYYSADGILHTAGGTFNDTATTEVAFVETTPNTGAVTDFYQLVSATSSVVPDGAEYFCIGITGCVAGVADPGVCFGVIQAAVKVAVAADIHGVGNIYGRSHTEHAAADSKIHYMEYTNAWGEIKYGICTQTATSADEIRFFEGTYGTTTDLVTTSTTYVGDFYRLRRAWTITTPTSDSHEWLMTDSACSNVDGSGGDIYGIIIEGQYESIHTLYHTPAGYDCWIGQWHAHAAQSAAADTYIFQMGYTPRYSLIGKTEIHEFVDNILHMSNPILLDEQTDITFSVADLATADNISGTIIIVEALRA